MAEKVYVIGIDPGLYGAIAVFKLKNSELALVGVKDMPVMENVAGKGKTIDCLALYNILQPFSPYTIGCVLEKVSARPTDGVSASFKFGKAAMAPEAVCYIAGISLHFIAPGVWKRSATLLKRPKEVALVKAKTLWPNANLFERKKDLGRADAALIGYYGYNLCINKEDKK